MVENEIALAKKEIDILKYLPPIVGNIRECKAVTWAENPQLQKLWKALDGGLKDQFVQDSTIYGVRRMEAILNIFPKSRENIENRKQRILARMNETLPYTFRKLEAWLLGICNNESFYMMLENEIYQLTIGLEYVNAPQAMEIYNEARKMIPANMILRQLMTINTPEPAPILLGIQSSMGIYTRVEPYQAGTYESDNTLFVGVISTTGVRIIVED